MNHRGEIIEGKVRLSKYSIVDLAKELGVSRNTLYTRFKEEKLSLDFIREVGRIIGYDFGSDFPELSTAGKNQVSDPLFLDDDDDDDDDDDIDYKKELKKTVSEKKVLMEKYFELSEKYQTVLEERNHEYAKAVELKYLKDKYVMMAERYIELLERSRSETEKSKQGVETI